MSCDFAPLRDAPERADAAGGSRFALDRALLNDLADLALQGAAGAAAQATPTSGWAKRCANMPPRKDDRLEHFDERSTRGFGLRVLLDGCWGFYGAQAPRRRERRGGRRARPPKRPRRAADSVAAHRARATSGP